MNLEVEVDVPDYNEYAEEKSSMAFMELVPTCGYYMDAIYLVARQLLYIMPP